MKKIAENRKGKCLSDRLESVRDKLKCVCEKGHVWEAVAYNVKNNGTWCKVCCYESTRKNLS